MTTFDSAITRAETDLTHVQSAVDTAQQVLEVADRAHSVGRGLVRMIRIVAIVFVVGGALVAVVVLFDRFWRGFRLGCPRSPEVSYTFCSRITPE